ncbi:CAP domain-containing protein [Maribacter sp. R77961]|uniref:CAP domain-containing protein n=1 Tax=Maribacter sp. R77961 TaxID=3093871 RepID=UPI0037C797A6
MKMRLLYVVQILFVLFLSSCTTDTVEDLPVVEADNVVHLENEILEIVNNHRTSLDMNKLLFSTVAYKYANIHTDYMISKGSLSHDNFSSRASSIASEEAVEMVAENVAKDYVTAVGAFEGWYNSVNHKKTMEGDFTHTAISVKKDQAGNFYFTQLFYRK